MNGNFIPGSTKLAAIARKCTGSQTNHGISPPYRARAPEPDRHQHTEQGAFAHGFSGITGLTTYP